MHTLRWLGWLALASCAAMEVACASSGGTNTDDGGANDASRLDAAEASLDVPGEAMADAADASADATQDAMPDGQGGGIVDAPADAGPDAKDAASEGGIVGPPPPLKPVFFGMSSLNATVLREDGTVLAWGFGGLGAVGDGTFLSTTSPVAVEGLKNPVFIGTGADARHQCVVMPDTTVECWGANEAGQLGNGTIVGSSTPVVVLTPPLAPSAPPPSDAGADSGPVDTCSHSPCSTGASLVAGCDPCAASVCASDNFCCTASWDTDCVTEATNQCSLCGGGINGTATCHSPCIGGAHLSGLCSPCAATVCAADSYCCLAAWDETCVAEAKSWCPAGTCTGGDLCEHTTCTAGTALTVGCNACATDICIQYDSTCCQSGQSWGSNCVSEAQAFCADPCGGSGDADSDAAAGAEAGATAGGADGGAVAGGPLTGVVAVTMGSDFTCALLAGGTITCWGGNENGQLGNGFEISSRTPVGTVPGLSNVTAIAAGSANVCALIADGTVQCWGYGEIAWLGGGDCHSNLLSPEPVSGLTDAVALCSASNHACAVRASGTVTCWGTDLQGQVGDGSSTTEEVCTPKDITTFSGAVDVACSSEASCAVTSDGHVWCWGANQNAEMANGTTSSTIFTPTQIATIHNAIGVRMGSYGACALTRNVDDAGAPDAGEGANDLLCWGYNADGEVGIGSTATFVTTPEIVP